ncbi:MAG: hypothetical protein SCARUB_03680 [Candidatus Scalindua rubra]|uniref:Uncharacterized protein n=1 Tax=Candidatus Scalindua rubra TaxID=1872076 RepID=A0A1E3X6N3_9BACT|nr:MAG: hypothetical protein SCARUB_03680 [Candidatus Scalindua rubra]
MSMNTEQLVKEILQLPIQQRAFLARVYELAVANSPTHYITTS